MYLYMSGRLPTIGLGGEVWPARLQTITKPMPIYNDFAFKNKPYEIEPNYGCFLGMKMSLTKWRPCVLVNDLRWKSQWKCHLQQALLSCFFTYRLMLFIRVDHNFQICDRNYNTHPKNIIPNDYPAFCAIIINSRAAASWGKHKLPLPMLITTAVPHCIIYPLLAYFIITFYDKMWRKHGKAHAKPLFGSMTS